MVFALQYEPAERDHGEVLIHHRVRLLRQARQDRAATDPEALSRRSRLAGGRERVRPGSPALHVFGQSEEHPHAAQHGPGALPIAVEVIRSSMASVIFSERSRGSPRATARVRSCVPSPFVLDQYRVFPALAAESSTHTCRRARCPLSRASSTGNVPCSLGERHSRLGHDPAPAIFTATIGGSCPPLHEVSTRRNVFLDHHWNDYLFCRKQAEVECAVGPRPRLVVFPTVYSTCFRIALVSRRGTSRPPKHSPAGGPRARPHDGRSTRFVPPSL